MNLWYSYWPIYIIYHKSLLEKDLAPKLSRTSNSLFLKVFILQKILYKHILYNLKIFIHFGYIDIKMEDWSFNLQKAALVLSKSNI